MNGRITIDRNTLLDLVHDRWFNLEVAAYDQTARKFTLELGEKRRGPYNDKQLVVTDVRRIVINDEAEIGVYDLCDVEIEEHQVRLVSCMPLQIELEVGANWTLSVIAP